MVSVLVKPGPDEPARFDLHVLQRLGSFLKLLSWKKCCSPAVKTKSAPQSTHLRTGGTRRPRRSRLFHFPAILLPVSLAGQRLLDPELLAWLQIEGVSLDLLDDVLLLDLAFEAA